MYTSSLARAGAQAGRRRRADQPPREHARPSAATTSRSGRTRRAPAGALYGHVQLLPQAPRPASSSRILVAPARLNRVSFGDADVVHLHGDDWFYLRRRLPTVRTLYGSALYEMRYATRARRMISQAALVPLEALACLLATEAYGMIPGDGPVHRLRRAPARRRRPGRRRSARERSERPSILFVGTWKGRKRGALLRDEFVRHVLPAHPDAELWCVSDACEESESVRWIQTPTDERARAALPPRLGLLPAEPLRGIRASVRRGDGARTAGRRHAEPRRALHHARRPRRPDRARTQSLGRTLAALLGDAERRAALAAAGRRRAAEFTWERAAERHEAAYRSAIERFHRRARRGSGGRPC